MFEKVGVYIQGLLVYMWVVLSSVLCGMQIIFIIIIIIEVSSQSMNWDGSLVVTDVIHVSEWQVG